MNSVYCTKCDSKNLWDTFLSQCDNSSIFSTYEFNQAVNRDNFDLWMVFENEVVVMGSIVSSGFSLYQGILMRSQHFDSHKKRQAAICSYTSCLITTVYDYYGNGEIVLNLDPQFTDIRPLQWLAQNILIEVKYTGIIHLDHYSSFQQYFDTLSRSKKKEFWKASSSGLRFLRSYSAAELILLHKATLKRQGIEFNDRSHTIENISSKGVEEGWGEIYYCMNARNEIIAGCFFSFFQDKAYWNFLGVNYDIPSYGASTFLYLLMIDLFFARGFKSVDLCGMNHRSRSEYKLSFNPTLCSYFRLKLTSVHQI